MKQHHNLMRYSHPFGLCIIDSIWLCSASTTSAIHSYQTFPLLMRRHKSNLMLCVVCLTKSGFCGKHSRNDWRELLQIQTIPLHISALFSQEETMTSTQTGRQNVPLAEKSTGTTNTFPECVLKATCWARHLCTTSLRKTQWNRPASNCKRHLDESCRPHNARWYRASHSAKALHAFLPKGEQT